MSLIEMQYFGGMTAKECSLVGVAHSLLTLIYQVLRSGQPYQERGLPVLDQRQKDRIIRHHIRRLGRLGIRVRSTTPSIPTRRKSSQPPRRNDRRHCCSEEPNLTSEEYSPMAGSRIES
jgi:hypothetical protein